MSRRLRLLLGVGDEDADLEIEEPSQGEELCAKDHRESRQVNDHRDSVISRFGRGRDYWQATPVVSPNLDDVEVCWHLDHDVFGLFFDHRSASLGWNCLLAWED